MSDDAPRVKKPKMIAVANGAVAADSEEENNEVVEENQEVPEEEKQDVVEQGQEVGDGDTVAEEEKEEPLAQTSSEVVDFSRPRAQQHTLDCVAILKGPNDVAIGFPSYASSMTQPPKSGRKIPTSYKPYTYEESFSGAYFTERNGKVEQTQMDHVFLLDQQLNINSKVMRFENKYEGTANEKRCKPKRKMPGIVTTVKETADIRIFNVDKNEVDGDIIKGVDLTGVKKVQSVTHRWDREKVVYGKVTGRVLDCIFQCVLRDGERRLIVTASCIPGSKNGVYISHPLAQGSTMHSYWERKPILLGDRVKIDACGDDARKFIEFLDDPPKDYDEANVEFIIEKMEMTRLQIQAPVDSTKPARFGGSLPNLSDLTSTPAPSSSPALSTGPAGLSPMEELNVLEGIVVDLSTAAGNIQQSIASTSAFTPAAPLLEFNSQLGHISMKLAGLKAAARGGADMQQLSGLWVEKKDLKKVHFLTGGRKNYNLASSPLLDFVLDGEYETASTEAYNSLLIRELKDVFSGNLLTPDEKPVELNSATFEKHKCVGQVVRHYTKVNVRWLDGTVSEGIPSYELCPHYRLAHPTETEVLPGMLTSRNVPLRRNEKKDFKDVVDESMFSDFGLVTSILEEERLLTVRWFRKCTSRRALFKYQFTHEEEVGIFDFYRHPLQRFPLGCDVKLKETKENKDAPMVDVVGSVVSNSDEGYQIVRLLNGEEKQIWPGDAAALHYDYSTQYGDYDYFDDGDFDLTQTGGAVVNAEVDVDPSNPGSVDPAYVYDDYDNDDSYDDTDDYSSEGPAPPSFADVAPPPPQALLQQFTEQMEAAAGSMNFGGVPTVLFKVGSAEVPTKRTKKKDSTLECNGGDCQKLVCSVTKSSEGKMDCPERLRAYAALRLLTYPDPPCRSIINNPNGVEEMLNSEELHDAQMYISFFLSKPVSDDEKEKFTALNSNHRGWEAKAAALFAVNEETSLSELALHMLGHLHDITPTLPAATEKLSRFSSRFYGFESPSPLLIFPANQDVKEKIEKALNPPAPPRPEGDPFGGFEEFRRKNRIQLSYFAPSHFTTIRVPDDKLVYHVQVRDGFVASLKDLIPALKTAVGDGVIIATESDANMMDHFMRTQLELQVGNSPTGRPLDDSTRFSQEKLWRSGLNAKKVTALLTSYYKGEKRPVDTEMTKIYNISFDFKKLAEKMGFEEDPLINDDMRQNSRDEITNMQFSAPSVAQEKVPETLKLEVAADCTNANFTDSYLAFNALSQILTSPIWPSCIITINKRLFAGDTLEYNFVRAILLLRKGGFIRGPYFNFAEAKVFEKAVTQEFVTKQGQLTERLGADGVEDLCKIMKKLVHTSCISLWKRLNSVEEHFPLQEIIANIRHIISHPNAPDTPHLVSIFSLHDKIASTANVFLRDELRSWISEELGDPTPAKGTFLVLEHVIPEHKFIKLPAVPPNRNFVRTIRKEHALLRGNLEEGLHVVTYEDRIDLFRAVIVGPQCSPYKDVPFIFDIRLPENYPASPPDVHFYSNSRQAINPNLYLEGKVCLSLLGTWRGTNPSQHWDPVRSNILQVVFSIFTEILMQDKPYFNEPGYEMRSSHGESIDAATRFNGQVIVGTLENLVTLIKSPPPDVAGILTKHFKDVIPEYLEKMRRCINKNEEKVTTPEFPIVFDKGLCLSLRRLVESAQKALQSRMDAEAAAPAAAVEAEEPKRVEQQQPSQEAMDLDSADEKRTLFSEGDPLYECAEYKNYVLLRLM